MTFSTLQTKLSLLGKHGNQEIYFFLIKRTQINICTCYLALSNCHTCYKGLPRRSVTKNKACDNRTHKLTMTCVGACACDCIPFLEFCLKFCFAIIFWFCKLISFKIVFVLCTYKIGIKFISKILKQWYSTL